jgi:hypothetical protein
VLPFEIVAPEVCGDPGTPTVMIAGEGGLIEARPKTPATRKIAPRTSRRAIIAAIAFGSLVVAIFDFFFSDNA